MQGIFRVLVLNFDSVLSLKSCYWQNIKHRFERGFNVQQTRESLDVDSELPLGKPDHLEPNQNGSTTMSNDVERPRKKTPSQAIADISADLDSKTPLCFHHDEQRLRWALIIVSAPEMLEGLKS